MKNIIALFAFVICIINCKAQQENQKIFPLNRYYYYFPHYSYMKDLDNCLSQYVGAYKADYKGNQITLYIFKENKKLVGSKEYRFYQDVLHIKYIVKNRFTGKILQDIQSNSSLNNKIISIGTDVSDNNSILLYYNGTHCDVGWGRISLKKINSKKISWSYYPYSGPLEQKKCQNNIDTKVYLPDIENFIFIKQ
jgi:hypothetical protein